jgi:hypothetical protein
LLQGIKVHEECIHGPEFPKDESDILLYSGKPLPKEKNHHMPGDLKFLLQRAYRNKENYQDKVSVSYKVL